MSSDISRISAIYQKIPEFCLSHWLIRIPVIIVFLQQGLMKFPLSIEDAQSYDLPFLVWCFAAVGEVGAGVGLLLGGMIDNKIVSKLPEWFGDLITRFSGITICCIMTGVIWTGEPESFVDVMLYDNLHVFLWVCGLFFALRGSRA